jgi:ribosomal protein L39E
MSKYNRKIPISLAAKNENKHILFLESRHWVSSQQKLAKSIKIYPKEGRHLS